MKWTTDRLLDLKDEMMDKLNNIQNTKYDSLTQYMYGQTINYYNNGTNIVFNNTPLFVGFDLVSFPCRLYHRLPRNS
ncbi:MAG: hypothetical protein P4M11_11110 [Candidatus Pacebacteria bacterium]|nr:hypothetical protein [Candidatus Paceibacterota bacterium]